MKRSKLGALKEWMADNWTEYQKVNRIKRNGYDTHEVAKRYNEYVASIADAKRYRWLRDNKHLDQWWSVEGPSDGPEDRNANIDRDIDIAMFEELLDKHYPEDARPAQCRERLREEGKAYPRSGCKACPNQPFGPCPHYK